MAKPGRPKAPRKAGRNQDAGLARQLLGVGTDIAAERGVRGANGLVKATDELKERLTVPGGGTITVQRPIPLSPLAESLKGLTPRQAMARLAQHDVESGEFAVIWERFKSIVKGGSVEAFKEYLDRVCGKATQNVALDARVQMQLSPEDRQILDGLSGLFGATPKKPQVVADVQAREVA